MESEILGKIGAVFSPNLGENSSANSDVNSSNFSVNFSANSPAKLTAYGAILIAMLAMMQYVSTGFFSEGLVTILRKGGADLHKIGLLYFLGFFWAIKFLWAPFVAYAIARFGGVCKHFILITQLLVLAALGTVSFLDVGANLGAIIAIAVFVSFLNATSDTASGALIFKISRANLGAANAFKTSGVMIGHVLGTGVAVIIFERFGWEISAWFLFALTFLTLLFIAFFKENSASNFAQISGEISQSNSANSRENSAQNADDISQNLAQNIAYSNEQILGTIYDEKMAQNLGENSAQISGENFALYRQNSRENSDEISKISAQNSAQISAEFGAKKIDFSVLFNFFKGQKAWLGLIFCNPLAFAWRLRSFRRF